MEPRARTRRTIINSARRVPRCGMTGRRKRRGPCCCFLLRFQNLWTRGFPPGRCRVSTRSMLRRRRPSILTAASTGRNIAAPCCGCSGLRRARRTKRGRVYAGPKALPVQRAPPGARARSAFAKELVVVAHPKRRETRCPLRADGEGVSTPKRKTYLLHVICATQDAFLDAKLQGSVHIHVQ